MYKNCYNLVRAANGEVPCDLSIENVQLVNVLTGEIYFANVDIYDGYIVRIRDSAEKALKPSSTIVDGDGNYLLPGFIDVHMHVESTMMLPENFGKAAITWGTTTAVTDPHEIANVLGVDGVNIMRHSAMYSPLRILTLVPSCVPASPTVEGAGAAFFKEQVSELLEYSDVIGVAEVMDYLGVIHNDERMRSIINAGREASGFIQGHAPYVIGKDLDAYLCGGPESDHEVRVANELREKMRKGMHVNIKSSSLSDTVQEFIAGISYVPYRDLVSLCTDDVHAADLLKTGHINHIVDACIEGGINPIEAIRFGTWNAARELRLRDLGAIAPGYIADLQLVDNLKFKTRPLQVYVAGKLVSKSGQVINDEVLTVRTHEPFKPRNTVHIPQITSPDVFKIPTHEGQYHLVFSAARENMVPNQIACYETFPENNGYIMIPDLDKYQFVSVVNRHGSGDITTVVCSDFHLKHGCIASTISHDSHNMTIVYRDPNDAYVAAKALESIGGGIVYVIDGNLVCALELPVGGLMSTLTAEELTPKIRLMNNYVEYATDGEGSMLLAIAILALPVRPGIIITDRGVIRGETQEFLPLVK